jgi:TatD DNase family protein
MLIDSHCHIYLPEFEPDRSAMIERALKCGVEKFIMPAIDAETHESLLQAEKDFDGKAFAMMGLHPCSVKENYLQELQIVKAYLEKRKFVAIGEIGLDYYWDTHFMEQQKDAMQQQIEWALAYDLPIVIHSRNSTDDCIALVKKHQQGKLSGVFHCFSGTAEQAQEIIDLGFFLGIGGVLTFKNAGLDKVIEHVPLESIILETDAPYLAPAPYRGKRNECSYIKLVADKLAAIKNIPVKMIEEVTTANAKKLFHL